MKQFSSQLLVNSRELSSQRLTTQSPMILRDSILYLLPKLVWETKLTETKIRVANLARMIEADYNYVTTKPSHH